MERFTVNRALNTLSENDTVIASSHIALNKRMEAIKARRLKSIAINDKKVSHAQIENDMAAKVHAIVSVMNEDTLRSFVVWAILSNTVDRVIGSLKNGLDKLAWSSANGKMFCRKERAAGTLKITTFKSTNLSAKVITETFEKQLKSLHSGADTLCRKYCLVMDASVDKNASRTLKTTAKIQVAQHKKGLASKLLNNDGQQA